MFSLVSLRFRPRFAADASVNLPTALEFRAEPRLPSPRLKLT